MQTLTGTLTRGLGLCALAALLAAPLTVQARDYGYYGHNDYQVTVRYRDYDHYYERPRYPRHRFKEHRHYRQRHYVGPYCPPPRHHRRSYYAPRYYDRGYGTYDFSLNYRYRD